MIYVPRTACIIIHFFFSELRSKNYARRFVFGNYFCAEDLKYYSQYSLFIFCFVHLFLVCFSSFSFRCNYFFQFFLFSPVIIIIYFQKSV